MHAVSAGGVASPRRQKRVEVLAPLVIVHATSPRRRTSLPTFTDRAIVVAASVYVDVRTSSFDATTHITHIHRRTRSPSGYTRAAASRVTNRVARARDEDPRLRDIDVLDPRDG